MKVVSTVFGHSSQFRDEGLRRILSLWPLLVPLVVLLPGLASFPYPSPAAKFSDLVITHYPNVVFLRRALLEWRSLPLWSPQILSGYPFAANPLSGLWYPPGWLAVLLPLPLGFNLMMLVHLLWGGLGMYWLLRGEGLDHLPALLGGLAFEAMPKLFAHYGAGHLTLLYAVPWTPWLLLTVEGLRFHLVFGRSLPAFTGVDGGRRVARPPWKFSGAVVLALIFLADVRWAAYAGAFWWAFTLAQRLPVANKLKYLVIQTVLALMLVAPLALPFFEYTRLSTRASMQSEDVLAFSMPPARFFGLVFPDFGGYHEWMVYAGGFILAAGLLAILWKNVRSQAGFWIWIAALAGLFALGSGIPLATTLSRLPGIGLLRVPSRALFILGISLDILAAYAVAHLIRGVSLRERKQANLMLLALCVFALALAGILWAVSKKLEFNIAWGLGVALLATGWITLRMKEKISSRAWWVVGVSLCLVDWAAVDFSLFSPHSGKEVFSEGRSVAQYLASQPGRFRVYSPSYSLPQQTAAVYGLELADGVDPMQLQSYTSYMEGATGVPSQGYSVTLPSFAHANPAQDNASYLPDPVRLGLLNIGFVAAEFDLQAVGLVQVARFGETRLYQNEYSLPRAWSQLQNAPPGQEAVPVKINSWKPDRFELEVGRVDAEEPRMLVLSELAYPGWRAWVNGKRAEVRVIAGLLRGVNLGPETQQVVFKFQPVSVYLGVGLFVFGILLMIKQGWR